VPGGGELVLLVEDEPALRELAIIMIERLGYRVADAGSGDEALALVEKQNVRPDVVLTDLVLPGISGRQLAEQLCRILPEAKIIYMSGYADDAIARDGTIGADVAFLQKPFTLASLSEKIKSVLAED
jgi:two-component system, cell cycle sensor histidine kinase and response regulator CckA